MHLDWFVNLCIFTIFAYISQLPLLKAFPPVSSSYCITSLARKKHNLFKSLERIRIIDWSLHVAVSFLVSMFFSYEGKVNGDSFYDWVLAASPGLPHPWTPPCDPAFKLGAVKSKDSENLFVEAPKISNSEYTATVLMGLLSTSPKLMKKPCWLFDSPKCTPDDVVVFMISCFANYWPHISLNNFIFNYEGVPLIHTRSLKVIVSHLDSASSVPGVWPGFRAVAWIGLGCWVRGDDP